LSLSACDGKKLDFEKPLFDSDGKHIGDSCFLGGMIRKIVFVDTTYSIDSVVFSRYDRLKMV
jgi:hypothetical protein